jgi:hypothetical protein
VLPVLVAMLLAAARCPLPAALPVPGAMLLVAMLSAVSAVPAARCAGRWLSRPLVVSAAPQEP